MPRLYNKRTDKNIPRDAVYIGRPGKWGNPARIGSGIPRDLAIELYKEYLNRSPKLLVDIRELRGKDLVCWCSPLPCHGDILLRLANG